MRKVHVVGGDTAYKDMFRSMGMSVVDTVIDADLVCFTGGQDVSPSYYGHPAHRTTFSSVSRDDHESGMYQFLLDRKIPMVGICRGGQFLNVMSGGEMYQDVSKHIMSHDITDLVTGETVFVSSTHHQMMKRSDRGLLVASSRQGGTREWWTEGVFKRELSDEDEEVVWYEHTKCLCFQPHPEFNGGQFVGMRTYFESLLNRYIWSQK